MGAPTTHQVQHDRVLRDLFFEQTPHGRYGPFIYMHYEARRFVEDAVVPFVLALERLG